ncbi:MAG TPA: metallophosphoesterase [Rhizobiales bacterium]|nr:metallophosphoesterase [Hyphomicrobiales bacterium]
MTTRVDLGDFTSPVAICGGVVSNLEALTAFAERMASLGIAADHIIHTGDVIAYCASPAECAGFVMARGWPAIKGNVEAQLAAGSDDCGCGFEDGTPCDLVSGQWYAYANAAITDDQRRWMAALPDHLALTMNNITARIVHGSPERINRYVFASSTDLEAQFDIAGADIIIAGHSGLPFTRRHGNHLWHNSGSLGLPANDGTARVWYSIIAPCDKGIKITHYALTYDHHTAAAKMQTAPLPQSYAKTLTTGLWPALDVLPEEEKSMTGQPLNPPTVIYP